LRYLLKQKLFALGNDFMVKDEEGNDKYFVDGKAFSIGDKLSFQDLRGTELAFIRQKLLAWGPTYEIYRSGKLVAMVKKDLFSPLHHTFNVDVEGPDDLQAKGNLLDYEYTFRRGEVEVAAVSKQWFTLRDTYGVDIKKDEDELLILASTVVIDLSCHSSRNRR
jgi:uncharacterized protein YxjI